jgi:predicted DNA-binding transcriptional regulator YafY
LRSFRVDRIEAVNLTDQVFLAPVGFDVRAYMAQEWQGTPQIQVRFRFDPRFSHLALYNRVYWESFVENPDGSVDVTLTTPDIIWAASNALAYGPAVTVLEPPEVRQLVREWAQATVELYSPEGAS